MSILVTKLFKCSSICSSCGFRNFGFQHFWWELIERSISQILLFSFSLRYYRFQFQNSGGTIVDSSALSTCSNVSTCTDPQYSTYECQVNLQKESNVLCETKYSIEANVKLSDADRTESIHLLNDVEFTCKYNNFLVLFLLAQSVFVWQFTFQLQKLWFLIWHYSLLPIFDKLIQ